MPSSADLRSRAALRLESWNRKLHYYLGLYFLLFIWLFSLTGLLLNHPRWALSRVPNEPRPDYERTIQAPAGDSDLARAVDVMRQLGLRGEIDWPQPRQAPGRLDFNVASPGTAAQVRVDLIRNAVTVRRFDRSLWSALRISHTFSGWRYNAPDTRRDWLLTSLWVVAMDALAVGLIVMVLGSYYMWFRLKPNHVPGWIALAIGYAAAAFFVFGFIPGG